MTSEFYQDGNEENFEPPDNRAEWLAEPVEDTDAAGNYEAINAEDSEVPDIDENEALTAGDKGFDGDTPRLFTETKIIEISQPTLSWNPELHADDPPMSYEEAEALTAKFREEAGRKMLAYPQLCYPHDSRDPDYRHIRLTADTVEGRHYLTLDGSGVRVWKGGSRSSEPVLHRIYHASQGRISRRERTIVDASSVPIASNSSYPERTKARAELWKADDANWELEASMGLNNLPIGRKEAEELVSLLNCATPMRVPLSHLDASITPRSWNRLAQQSSSLVEDSRRAVGEFEQSVDYFLTQPDAKYGKIIDPYGGYVELEAGNQRNEWGERSPYVHIDGQALLAPPARQKWNLPEGTSLRILLSYSTWTGTAGPEGKETPGTFLRATRRNELSDANGTVFHSGRIHSTLADRQDARWLSHFLYNPCYHLR